MYRCVECIDVACIALYRGMAMEECWSWCCEIYEEATMKTAGGPEVGAPSLAKLVTTP